MPQGRNYVLIVEDDQRVSEYVRRALELQGFGTVAAGQEEDDWGALVRERPAVAVVDLRLPDGSGWSLVQRMRADWRFAGLPVLIITGAQEPDLDEKAAELGCDVLRKPFEHEDLLERLRGIMVRALEVVLFLEQVRITGVVHAPPSASRFSDAWEGLLSDERRFIPATDAMIATLDGRVVDKLGFVQIAKDGVWAIFPASEQLGGE